MAINHDEFVRTVQDRGGLDSPEQARRAARATLATFSERVSYGAAEDLFEELPTGIRDAAVEDGSEDPESFNPDEFVARVADREQDYPGLDRENAREHVEAVLTALRDLASEPWEEAASQLPGDYERLYERAYPSS